MEKIGNIAKRRLDQIVIENKMMRGGFSALPYVLLRDKDLSVGSRLAYAFLLMYGWQENSSFAGQERMALDMGISRAQVQRFLYELRDGGYIRIERKDKRYNKTYYILDKGKSLKRRA